MPARSCHDLLCAPTICRPKCARFSTDGITTPTGPIVNKAVHPNLIEVPKIVGTVTRLGKSAPPLSRVVATCANGEFSQEFRDRFGGLIDVHEVTNGLTVHRTQRACDTAR